VQSARKDLATSKTPSHEQLLNTDTVYSSKMQ
jgi:hypothetical protein